ncbi:tyrosine-type recombinase/integrase [Niallia taxi]|nr:tyrosine-type recombinase/integrase [Niallia taxi]MDE5054856.1 tyrosine-type recombinase/integrase [Niallia taxi]
MASFAKRGKTWQYTISRMIDGKSKPIRKGGFKTKKEAQVAAAEVESELRSGTVLINEKQDFVEYFQSWISTYKTNITNNTLERYKNTLKTIAQNFEGVSLQDINKRSYQTFINSYASNHAKESTRKLNTHIRACVRDAIDEGLIKVDFTRNVVITGSIAAKKPDEKHLDFNDSQLLLEELYRRLERGLGYYLLLLGLTSGARFAELVGLTRNDFNFKTNEITINKTWAYTNKMGNGFGPTKNEQSNRTIKMDRKTMNVFQKLFDSTPDNIHRLVFFSPSSKFKVLSNTSANKDLKKVLTDLKIEPIALHGLRHTHASVLLYKKVSIYYVSERLGHGDIQTTLKYYAHIVKELRLKDELDTIKIFESMAK